jgi:hypothetical protein
LTTKSNAPLNRFPSLVCSELSIVDTADDLQKKSWELEIDVDGIMKLKRVLEITPLKDYITHTAMTEKDIFWTREDFISYSIGLWIISFPSFAQDSAQLFCRLVANMSSS